MFFLFFFFSSRRRHTRFDCDWSSDVCSSDLVVLPTAHSPRNRRGPTRGHRGRAAPAPRVSSPFGGRRAATQDRKSTRLNSSHSQISYAVFCLKKKKICKALRSRLPGVIERLVQIAWSRADIPEVRRRASAL